MLTRRVTATALCCWLVLASLGCAGPPDTDAAGSATDDTAVDFVDGGEVVDEFQLALETMVFSHLDALIKTDELLAWDGLGSASDWHHVADDTEAAWARAEHAVADFQAAIDALPADVPDPPAADDDSGSLLDLFRPETALALGPDQLGRDVALRLDYDGNTDPRQDTYEPSELSFQTGLVAEFDSLAGTEDRWQVLADRYDTSVEYVAGQVAEGRQFLQGVLDDDVMYATEAEVIAQTIETGSDVALFALSGGGTGLATVGRMGLRAAVAQSVARQGLAVTAVKGAEYASLAIDVYDTGTLVFLGERPGPMLTPVREGLGLLQNTVFVGDLALDAVGTALDPGNLKTIHGWGSWATQAVSDGRIPGVFEVDGALVAGPFDTSVVESSDGGLSGLDFATFVPPGLEGRLPLTDFRSAGAGEHAGTYRGTYEIPVPPFGSMVIPMTIVIGEDGTVQGTWSHATAFPGTNGMADYTVDGGFTGMLVGQLITGDGTSDGSVTGPYSATAGSGPFSVDATVSDGTITGTMSGEAVVAFSASR